LFKYFWEATDEAHPVSLADISAQLKEHGITADPRTLRSDIEQLVEFGVDIVKERRVQNLYHVATRHFEAPEVKLLIDAVQSARFITPGKSKELVKRLTTFVAPGDAALLERHLYIDSRVKAVNESVYISVDRIQTAIAERKRSPSATSITLPPRSACIETAGKSIPSPHMPCSGITIPTTS
ncbi:MAG: hypothetical protein ACLU3I_20530, partial [Acutalibacteraceae bacterium]